MLGCFQSLHLMLLKKLHDILEAKEIKNNYLSFPKAMECLSRNGLQLKAIF